MIKNKNLKFLKAANIRGKRMNSALLKSPLIGAFLLTVTSIFYFTFSMVSIDINNLSATFEQLMGVVKLIPLMFIIFSIISYIFFIPVGYLLYKDLNNNFRSERFFINASMLIGFILSIIISYFDYNHYHLLAKSFFIVIAITVMATANASYFMVLSEHIKIKENNNEKTKGNRV